MREIGGYMELEYYHMPMVHDGMLAFNCARNCLAYLIEKKHIKKIYIPKFLCDSVSDICQRYFVKVEFYSIGRNFMPESLEPELGSWVYLVNYYGQLSNDTFLDLKNKYKNIIIDNVQAYFQEPLGGVDTIYTCRKFFGVTDGAFLSSDLKMGEEVQQDESFERTHFLLGRFERSALEFYSEYTEREDEFIDAPIRRMSKLTENLLHAIDYEAVLKTRTENFVFFHERFADRNRLELTVPKGPYMYPLYVEHGAEIRKKLQTDKIFVPILWPDVINKCGKDTYEYDMAENILPLPVDQRYGIEDMRYVADKVEELMEETL